MVGLPKTLALSWRVSVACQRVAPSCSENATSRGAPLCATGTKAVWPSMAALPVTGAPTFLVHSGLPVTASSP